MKAVIVRYRVAEAFVAENAGNIARVLEAHRDAAHPGVRYFASQDRDDPQAFVHIGLYEDGAAVDAATNLESFQEFQAALKASGLLERPQATWLTPLGTGFPFPA